MEKEIKKENQDFINAENRLLELIVEELHKEEDLESWHFDYFNETFVTNSLNDYLLNTDFNFLRRLFKKEFILLEIRNENDFFTYLKWLLTIEHNRCICKWMLKNDNYDVRKAEISRDMSASYRDNRVDWLLNNLEEIFDYTLEDRELHALFILFSVNGKNIETLNDWLYAEFGYRNLKQYFESENQN